MKISTVNGFEVTGFVIRTTNADEVNPSTSKMKNCGQSLTQALLKSWTKSQWFISYTQTMSLIFQVLLTLSLVRIPYHQKYYQTQ